MNRPGARIAIVGCGFVADYYVSTLAGHPELTVVGAFDRDRDRLDAFTRFHSLRSFGSLDEVLADPQTQIVVNLTNPRSHYEVSRQALLAGKHVYSEKPLAMELSEAKELAQLATDRGLHISAAPCSLLGEAAQTVWADLRRGSIGPVRVVYAEMDEGLVHQMPFDSWVSASGAPWPFRDEFEVGTVVEHAGYIVSWLPAMFGSAVSVTGFADCLVPDKAGVATSGTDFAVAVARFASGVVARLTFSLIAPHDHSFRIVGDRGVLRLGDTWFYGQRPVRRRSVNVKRRPVWLPGRRVPLRGKPEKYRYGGTQQMDFARGVADLAAAIAERRSPRLSTQYCLHVTELVLALSASLRQRATYEMTTSAGAVDPMSWAR